MGQVGGHVVGALARLAQALQGAGSRRPAASRRRRAVRPGTPPRRRTGCRRRSGSRGRRSRRWPSPWPPPRGPPRSAPPWPPGRRGRSGRWPRRSGPRRRRPAGGGSARCRRWRAAGPRRRPRSACRAVGLQPFVSGQPGVLDGVGDRLLGRLDAALDETLVAEEPPRPGQAALVAEPPSTAMASSTCRRRGSNSSSGSVVSRIWSRDQHMGPQAGVVRPAAASASVSAWSPRR